MRGWEDWPSKVRICSSRGSRRSGSEALGWDASFKYGPDSACTSSKANGPAPEAERCSAESKTWS